MKKIFTYPRLAIFVLATIIAFVACHEAAVFSGRGLLTVAMLDIGQGDAIFIETPSGNQILVDGGSGGKILQELSAQMSFFDKTIDMLVVTNPDKDHVGGFIDVLSHFEISAVIEPGTTPDTAVYKKLTKLITEEGAEKIIARRGMDFALDTDVHLVILFPDRDVSMLDTNDGSIVAKLIYKNTSMMLTGDTVDDVERYLVDIDGKKLESDILKIAHHGSKTSSSEEFIAAVSPRFALISAGKNNRYGHPTEEVLERLSKHNILVLGTYEEGTIVFGSDGEEWRRK